MIIILVNVPRNSKQNHKLNPYKTQKAAKKYRNIPGKEGALILQYSRRLSRIIELFPQGIVEIKVKRSKD